MALLGGGLKIPSTSCFFSCASPGGIPERKGLFSSSASARDSMALHNHNFLSQHSMKRNLPIHLSSMNFLCAASSNSQRRNPDFSRRNRGLSRGRNRQSQERENSENLEDADFLPSKNGPSLTISSNSRYQATAAPGQREKEIVELFRKVQAQLRERAAIKEEKKIETSQQGEKGTVDSLLNLLRKHTVDHVKRTGSEEEYNFEQPERSNPFDEEQTSNFFEVDSIGPGEGAQEPSAIASSRPSSNFRRRSPVPRVKYQPVYSAVEHADSGFSSKSREKKVKKVVTSVEPDPEPVLLDERKDAFEDESSEISEVDVMETEVGEPSSIANTELSSMKLTELRELAKSQGIKGYSKLKKLDLIKRLSGEGA